MKVADLTTDEHKELIRKTIEEKFRELIDPDFGLEILFKRLKHPLHPKNG